MSSSHHSAPTRLPDPRTISPRRWLIERTAIRQYVSLLVAPAAVGKTAYVFSMALGGAIGHSLLGDRIFTPVPVWIFNLEDPLEEMDRRLAAAMLHHGVSRKEVEGRIFMNSGRDRRVTMARLSGDGQVCFPDEAATVAQAKANQIGLLVVDPFVNSHELNENDNAHMNSAVRAWAEVASEADCSVFLVHHTRKGMAEHAGDIEGARGGKSLSDAARVGLTLTAMTEEEAKGAGLQANERWRYLRLDDGKPNLTMRGSKPRWFKLVSVPLGNGDDLHPDGDTVQTIKPWEPPSAFGDMTDADANSVLDDIDRGMSNGSRYTLRRTGEATRWAGHLLIDGWDRDV